jgi:hypothetical protein
MIFQTIDYPDDNKIFYPSAMYQTVVYPDDQQIVFPSEIHTIGWAPYPTVNEIIRESGSSYDRPISPDSLLQWIRPMPTRARPP